MKMELRVLKGTAEPVNWDQMRMRLALNWELQMAYALEHLQGPRRDLFAALARNAGASFSKDIGLARARDAYNKARYVALRNLMSSSWDPEIDRRFNETREVLSELGAALEAMEVTVCPSHLLDAHERGLQLARLKSKAGPPETDSGQSSSLF